MTFDNFKSRLDVIRQDYETVQQKAKEYRNPFFTDLYGVPADWLDNLILHHMFTLFKAVNPKIPDDKAVNEIDYYVFEQNFGGEVSFDGRTYDLTVDKDLYGYLLAYGD